MLDEKQKKELKSALTKSVNVDHVQMAVSSGIPFAKIMELVSKYGPMVIPIIQEILSLVNQNQNPPVLKKSKGVSNG